MTEAPIGPVLHSFFADHLITVKGLRPASVRSYRDTIRLLAFRSSRPTRAAGSPGSRSLTSPLTGS